MTLEIMAGPPQQPWVGPPPLPPVPPRAVDEATTPHVVHLLVTLLGGLLTFGLLFLWAFVWLLHAIVNDIGNRNERRRYAEAVQQYRGNVQAYEAALLGWQDRHYRVHGWVPQPPPIPRF